MKTPPNDLEAEIAVLGAVLLHAQETAPKALPLLQAQDFYHPSHAAIWEAIQDADNRHDPIDAVTVWAALKRLGREDQLNAVQGEAYLSELMGQVVTVENVEHHARQVATKAERRRTVMAFGEVMASGLNEQVGDAEWFQAVENVMLKATTERRTGYKAPEIRDALRDYMRELGERYQRTRSAHKLIGVPTGFAHLDLLTGGLRPGQQVVIAARPAMGKSAFVLNMLVAAAMKGTAVYVCSAEMMNVELLERIVASEANVDSTTLRNGTLNQVDWVKVSKASTGLADLPITLDDDGCVPISELRSRVRRWRLTKAKDAPSAMVVVDYLQLLKGSGNKRGNREQEVSEISQGLKGLAKECRCPVVSLAQLNRELERRTDKRPIMSDLRESGAIEQDADIIAFLYRDEVYNDAPDNPLKGTAELIIAKHRAGACGRFWLDWDSRHTRFTTRETSPVQEYDA